MPTPPTPPAGAAVGNRHESAERREYRAASFATPPGVGGVRTRCLLTGCTVLWQLSQNLVESEFTIQSFSNAIHPFRPLTNPQVALFFRAEDGRIGLPVSAMMPRYYAGVHSKGSYRNGERLYRDLKAGYYEVAPRRIVEFTLYVELRSGQSEVDKAKSPLWALVTPS